MIAVLTILVWTAYVHSTLRARPSTAICCVATALLLGTILSSARLLRGPGRYRDRLASVVERNMPLPELHLIATLFLIIFLLLVGDSLTTLMAKPFFSGWVTTLLVATSILPPVLMSDGRRVLFRSRVFSFLLGLLVALMIAEAACRILVKNSIYHPALDLRPGIRLEIRNEAPGLSPISIHTTNSLGLRGEEPPGDREGHFTILTIGGSTTHCFAMDDSTTWSWLLQEDLRAANPGVWIGNGGLNGHTSRGHVLFMTEVVPRIDPDMVIVLCGFNDLSWSLRPEYVPEGEPPAPSETARLWDHVEASSVLVQILTRWKQVVLDDAPVVTDMTMSHPGTRLEIPESPLPPDLSLILPSLQPYGSNIRTIIDLGRRDGVKMVFLTQPTLLEDDAYWRSISYCENQGLVYSCATISRMLDIFNSDLMRACSAENIPCFDLAGALAHESSLYVDEIHFTEAGTREIARLVSEYLISEGLVPIPDMQF